MLNEKHQVLCVLMIFVFVAGKRANSNLLHDGAMHISWQCSTAGGRIKSMKVKSRCNS